MVGREAEKNRARNCANDIITGLGREEKYEEEEKGAAMTQQGDRNLSGVHVFGKVDLY